MSNAVCARLTKYYLIRGGKPALLHRCWCQIPPVQHPALQVCHQPALTLPITSPVAALIFLHRSPWMSAIRLACCARVVLEKNHSAAAAILSLIRTGAASELLSSQHCVFSKGRANPCIAASLLIHVRFGQNLLRFERF